MSEYRFFHPVEVRYGDLDPQGHVNNAKHLTYFEQARIHYWIELGLFSRDQSFMEIGVIVADAHIRYLEPVRWGYPLKVGVRTTAIGNKSFTMQQCLMDHGGQRMYSEGTLVHVAYDYIKGASIRVPDEWRTRIQGYEGRPLE
ncbi:MAG TPA: thioesterase family protein [Anaerolineales bacterium]|nr:thioesterase family protein [Anaerolineales bacterium]